MQADLGWYTSTQTFSLCGLRDFEVQYWNGSGWQTVPGGSITGNNLVWRKLTFAAVTTSKIRVWINYALATWSRVVEVQAWTASSGSSSANIHWLVTDQLGTPRMVFDQSGSLANVSRHDYLPFGEEVPAGFRSGIPGYATGDNVRQKFTEKERDNETGLDYFLARYYSAAQGRFASVDPFSPILTKQLSTDSQGANRAFNSWISEPQRWNRYEYALNNPVRYVDKDGEDPQDALEILKRGLQRLESFGQLTKNLLASGKANIAAQATEMALEALFGNVYFHAGGLGASEIEFAKQVSAFEGRSFQGTPKATQGIDGFLHDGNTPTRNPRPIELQQNSTGETTVSSTTQAAMNGKPRPPDERT